MKLGIMSDNHGHLTPVNRALRVFDEHGVEVICHCGDLGNVDTLNLLAGRRFWFVLGNTDVPDNSWRPLVRSCGTAWPDEVPVVIKVRGVSIGLCHGHEPGFRRVCRSGLYDYVFHGHTHAAADHHVGSTRIVNPGALSRALTKTVAILDIDRDILGFYDITSGFQT